MVTPRTARYLLLGIVAACISATATLAAFDATRPVASRTAATQPSQVFHIPSYAPGIDSGITVDPAQIGAQGSRVVTLVPGAIIVAPAEGLAR